MSSSEHPVEVRMALASLLARGYKKVDLLTVQPMRQGRPKRSIYEKGVPIEALLRAYPHGHENIVLTKMRWGVLFSLDISKKNVLFRAICIVHDERS